MISESLLYLNFIERMTGCLKRNILDHIWLNWKHHKCHICLNCWDRFAFCCCLLWTYLSCLCRQSNALKIWTMNLNICLFSTRLNAVQLKHCLIFIIKQCVYYVCVNICKMNLLSRIFVSYFAFSFPACALRSIMGHVREKS